MLDDEQPKVAQSQETIVFKNCKSLKETPLYQVCFSAVELAAKTLQLQSDAKFQETQYSQGEKQLGFHKMRALEFLQKILQAFESEILLQFIDASVYKTLVYLIEEFPYNNLLQLRVDQIFT